MKKQLTNHFVSLFRRLKISQSSLVYSFIKNTSFIGLSRIFASLISYLIIILITRYLGADGLGQYSFIFSFVGIFFILSDWGLSNMMVKDLSRDPGKTKKYVSNIFGFKIIASLLSFIVYVTIIPFIDKSEIIYALVIAGIIQLDIHLNAFAINILRIRHNGKAIAVGTIAERFIALIVGGIILITYQSLTLLIVALLISQILKTVLLYIYLPDIVSIKPTIDRTFLLNLIKQGFPFIFVGIFTMIYVRMDTIMLSFMKGDFITGTYNAPYKLINVLTMMPSLLMVFGFPLFSRLHKQSKKMLRTFLEQMIHLSLLFILPIVPGVFIFSDKILMLVYGFDYIESIISFKILIVGAIFIFLTTILGQLIAAVGKQDIFAKIAGSGAILNILLNIILIPEYSLYGAGLATTNTYIFMFLAMIWYTRKNIIDFSWYKILTTPFIALLCITPIIVLLQPYNISFVVIISAVVYTSLVIFLEKLNIKYLYNS